MVKPNQMRGSVLKYSMWFMWRKGLLVQPQRSGKSAAPDIQISAHYQQHSFLSFSRIFIRHLQRIDLPDFIRMFSCSSFSFVVFITSIEKCWQISSNQCLCKKQNSGTELNNKKNSQLQQAARWGLSCLNVVISTLILLPVHYANTMVA